MRGTVSQYYCKSYLAPIFRPVIRIICEFDIRRKISANGGLSDQAAGAANFVLGMYDVPFLRWGIQSLERVGGPACGALGRACPDSYRDCFFFVSRQKRINISKLFLLETLECPPRGKSSLIESFPVLFYFLALPQKVTKKASRFETEFSSPGRFPHTNRRPELKLLDGP